MEALIQRATASTYPKRDGGKLDLVLTGLCLGLPWLLLFNRLRVDWSVNPQYSFGWVVPLLSAGLFWRRWSSRPDVSVPKTTTRVRWLVCASLLALLPIRLIEEANPEWRLALWSNALVLLVISLGALFLAGGWPWVLHFSFPLAFLLVSVPWPAVVESTVVQNLMQLVSAVTVEMLDLVNVPALQHGNL